MVRNSVLRLHFITGVAGAFPSYGKYYVKIDFNKLRSMRSKANNHFINVGDFPRVLHFGAHYQDQTKKIQGLEAFKATVIFHRQLSVYVSLNFTLPELFDGSYTRIVIETSTDVIFSHIQVSNNGVDLLKKAIELEISFKSFYR